MSQKLLHILQHSHSINHKLQIVQDSHIINVEHCHNHEERKIDLITAPFMPHDDQLSLAFALSISPKPCNFSSIKLLLHPNFNLDLVHTKENTKCIFRSHPLVFEPLPSLKFLTLNLKWALYSMNSPLLNH